MFRFIMIAIMFLICTLIGFYIGERYRQRSLNLKEIQKAIMLLNSEIIYANTPLPQALLDISKKVLNPISKILSKTSENLEGGEVASVYEGFNNAYDLYKEEVNLSKEDYKITSDFFKTLGECGVIGQEKIFKLVLEQLNMNYLDASKEAKANIKMYRTLGLALGLMIAIFFI